MRNHEFETKRRHWNVVGALLIASGALAATPSVAASFQTVMSGASPIWPDDRFMAGRETLTGRSAAVPPTACSDDTKPANLGSGAERLMFDSYPVRCGGFVAMPVESTPAR